MDAVNSKPSLNPLYVFVPLVLGLTVGFGIIMGSSSRDDTMAHWPDRRCDLDVILAAFMYKPSDDSSSSFEFSSNNFKFCVGIKAEEYLNTLFGSLFGILQTQMGAADIMTSVMKVMRIQLANIYSPFSSMMNNFWHKFKQIGTLASRIFQHLYMSMKKAAATATATIYIAISLQTAFMNSLDFIIKIIMIVLYILMALAFIFFLPILPVLIIVFLTTAGIEAGFPGKTGGMGTVFCFAPDTKVILEKSSLRNIQDIKVGMVLRDGQQVEAVIEVPGSDELYMIDGIRVSGEHLVHYKTEYITVKEHPEAIKVQGLDTLWTLITSNRQIPVWGWNGLVLFSDWEEMLNTSESAKIWESIVQTILNPEIPSEKSMIPQNAPCFDRRTLVQKYQSGLVPISDICRGDWIMGHDTWTQVIGVCERRVSGGIGSVGSRMTDGVWMWNSKTSSWNHPSCECDTRTWQGIHLLTESGSFTIQSATGLPCIVRDFTEVGWTNLAETYIKERSKNL